MILFLRINERYSGLDVLGLPLCVEAAELGRCASSCDIWLRAASEAGCGAPWSRGISCSRLEKSGGALFARPPGFGVEWLLVTSETQFSTVAETAGGSRRRYLLADAQSRSGSSRPRFPDVEGFGRESALYGQLLGRLT